MGRDGGKIWGVTGGYAGLSEPEQYEWMPLEPTTVREIHMKGGNPNLNPNPNPNPNPITLTLALTRTRTQTLKVREIHMKGGSILKAGRGGFEPTHERGCSPTHGRPQPLCTREAADPCTR